MASKLFGTDGVRGVANEYPITVEFAQKLAMVSGFYLCNDKKKVLIGRDTRVSGNMLESAMAAGFMAAGVDVVLLGVIPTPALSTLAPKLGVDMAVMITASHNPYYDNGIKLISADGNKFSDAETTMLEEKMLEELPPFDKDEIGAAEISRDAILLYLEKAKSFIKEERALEGLRVVLDCANGSFSNIMPQVFKNLGAGVISLANVPDGYNINKNCGALHPEQMFEVVRNTNAHIGIAVDGDGDRIVVCDENGQKIVSEQLMAFLLNYLREEGKYRGNAVVSTIISNPSFERYVNSLGMEYYSTKVGERAIVEKMIELNCGLGGEESGHIVALDYSQSGDAMVLGLMLSLALLKSGKKMSEIFPIFAMDEVLFVSVDMPSNEAVRKVVVAADVLRAVKDGQEKLAENGRIVLHPSGTEPKVRVWVAGKNKALVNEVGESILKQVRKFAFNKEA